MLNISRLTDFTHCNVCEAEATRDKPLRKCARCGIAVYCSKECQKTDWPKHKHYGCYEAAKDSNSAADDTPTDGQRPEGVDIKPIPDFARGKYFFSSPVAGVASFNKWRVIHQWSIQTMFQAMSYLGQIGSPEEIRRTPHVVRYYAQVTPGKHETDEHAWFLEQWRYETVEEILKEDGHKEAFEEMRGPVAGLEAEFRAEYGDRPFAILPVLFFMEGTGTTTANHYPILAPRNPDLLNDTFTRNVLEDLVSLCRGFMTLGIPIMAIPESPGFALPARVWWDKKVKRYAGVPMGQWDDPGVPPWRGIFHTGRVFQRKSDVNPVQMMALLAML